MSCKFSGSVKWDGSHNNYIWSIVGEWRVVNCRVNNNNQANATLWRQDGDTEKKIEIDEKRIKTVSKNKFNFTSVMPSDMGKYYCKACDAKITPYLRVNVKKGKTML